MISTCQVFLTSKRNYPRSPLECSSGLLWNHKLASQGHFHSGVGWVVDLWLRRRSASFAFHQDKISSPLCEISSLWHYNFLSRVSTSQDAQPELVSAHVDSRSRPFVRYFCHVCLSSKHIFFMRDSSIEVVVLSCRSLTKTHKDKQMYGWILRFDFQHQQGVFILDVYLVET